MDGNAGAFVVWKWCEQQNMPPPVLVGVRPGQSSYDFPDVTGKSVAIVDICFSREIMESIAKQASELVVLDHHKTSQDNMAGLDYCIFSSDRSGCQMAWDYFFGETERPRFIEFIGNRDLWNFSLPKTKEFSSAMFNRCQFERIEDAIDNMNSMFSWTDDDYKAFIEFGDICMEFEEKEVAQAVKYATKCKFHLPNSSKYYTVQVSDSRNYRSEIGSRLASMEGIDFAVIYNYNIRRDEWWISLRASAQSGTDLTKITKFFPGGGGHKLAAGFTLHRPLTTLLEPIYD